MRNIFKRKKREQNNEPLILSLEIRISQILLEQRNKPLETVNGSYNKMEKALQESDKLLVFRLCGSSDIYPYTFITQRTEDDAEILMKAINDESAMDVICFTLSEGNLAPFLWSAAEAEILQIKETPIWILKEAETSTEGESNCIEITKNREFLFGDILAGSMQIQNTRLVYTWEKICFNNSDFLQEGFSNFGARLNIQDKEIPVNIAIEGNGSSINLIAKEMIKRLSEKLKENNSLSVNIKSAGPLDIEQRDSTSIDFTLEGTIFSSGKILRYLVSFPKKLLSFFPEQYCLTVKGKIHQLNRLEMEKHFSTFHRSSDPFLFEEFLSHLTKRDLNLICQNFFLSQSIGGDYLRRLIRYKETMEDKSRIQNLPFSAEKQLLRYLPNRIKEEYEISKAYSSSLEDLQELNKEILRKIYESYEQEKLLLSPNGALLLQREVGSRAKTDKMLRLKKLMSDERYLRALSSLEPSKAQLLLNSMKHQWLSDSFVYQSEKLTFLKPHMSQNRFKELREDIKLTQKKIQQSQIDINRIGDSLENFYREIRVFIEKEKKLSRKNSGRA